MLPRKPTGLNIEVRKEPLINPKLIVTLGFKQEPYFYRGIIGKIYNSVDNSLQSVEVNINENSRSSSCRIDIYQPEEELNKIFFDTDLSYKIAIEVLSDASLITYEFLSTKYVYNNTTKIISVYGQQKTVETSRKTVNTAYENFTLKQLVNIALKKNDFKYLNMNEDGAIYEYFPVRNQSLWEAIVDEFEERGYTHFANKDTFYAEIITKDNFVSDETTIFYAPSVKDDRIINKKNSYLAPKNIRFEYGLQSNSDGYSITSPSKKTNILEVKRRLNIKTGEIEETAVREIEKNQKKNKKDDDKNVGTEGVALPKNRPVYKEDIAKSQEKIDAKNKLGKRAIDDINASFSYPITEAILKYKPTDSIELFGYDNTLSGLYKIGSVRLSFGVRGYNSRIQISKPFKDGRNT